MTSSVTAVLLLIPIFLLQYNPIMAEYVEAAPGPTSSNLFASDLFSSIVEKRFTQNVCFSPASIHSSLALIHLGAAGQTAEELRKVLKLEQKDKSQLAQEYGQFLQTIFKTTTADEEAPELKMATRLYVDSGIKISQQFNKFAEDNFQSEAENVDFSQAQSVVEKINKWVEGRTANKIKDLLKQDAINSDTSCVLVNAIYFKAKWLFPFSSLSTSTEDFFKNRNEIVKVDMMYTDEYFRYAELDDLGAKALEMPYKHSNISMLILLPNEFDGLQNLENRLKGVDLNDISSKLEQHKVDVFLPKFRIEFDIDLKESLEKLGCSSMFARNANLSDLFDSATPQRITDVKHKAFIECNEDGTEAAAAIYYKSTPTSAVWDRKTFRANHPFVFAIRSKDAVYFSGHAADF